MYYYFSNTNTKSTDCIECNKAPTKRHFIIEKQIARSLCNAANIFQTPLPFFENQIINSFLNSMISANNEKGEEFQRIGNILYSLLFFYCRMSLLPPQLQDIPYFGFGVSNFGLITIFQYNTNIGLVSNYIHLSI